MKKITEEEAEKLNVNWNKKNTNPINSELNKLEVNEILFISDDEYTNKSKLSAVISQSMSNKYGILHGKKFITRKVIGGWVSKRIK